MRPNNLSTLNLDQSVTDWSRSRLTDWFRPNLPKNIDYFITNCLYNYEVSARLTIRWTLSNEIDRQTNDVIQMRIYSSPSWNRSRENKTT